jgi:16S rRNA (cytosine1402-N4)-methyltransferase
MALDRFHEPVLATEIVELFSSLPEGVVVDATLGGAGHTEALLAAASHLRVLGIDRDPAAITEARARLASFTSRALVVKATFAEIGDVLARETSFLGDDPMVGVLMDLGVSSHQLDEVSRGFSFRADAPLDMRMDPTSGESAADYLSHVDAHELARLLRNHGEGRCGGASGADGRAATRPRRDEGLSGSARRGECRGRATG